MNLMVKNGLMTPPPKYGVYTGTKEGDKKTSGKVICNFEKYVNYIAGWNYNFRGKGSPCNLCYAAPFGTEGVLTQYQTRW